MDGAMVDGEASSASHAAAKRIQNAWRRRCAVGRFLSLLEAAQRQQQEEHAARLVQGLFRKVKARRKFAEVIQAVKEQKAAMMLQRNARSFVFRQQSRMQVDETSLQVHSPVVSDEPDAGDLTGIYRILNGTMAKLVQRGSSITVTVLPPYAAIWSPARGVVEDGGRVSLRFGKFGMDVAKLKTSRVPHELLWADGSSWVQISTDIAGYTPRPLSKTPPPRPASGSFLRPITPKMFRKRMGF
jgi:hypothetical protein